jgi:F-type H+-transporting ATPase subunit c
LPYIHIQVAGGGPGLNFVRDIHGLPRITRCIPAGICFHPFVDAVYRPCGKGRTLIFLFNLKPVIMTGTMAAVGAGLAVIGAGLGIGRIGGSAMDAIARQPEASSKIQINMIVAAALIEGAALFAIVVALIAK